MIVITDYVNHQNFNSHCTIQTFNIVILPIKDSLFLRMRNIPLKILCRMHWGEHVTSFYLSKWERFQKDFISKKKKRFQKDFHIFYNKMNIRSYSIFKWERNVVQRIRLSYTVNLLLISNIWLVKFVDLFKLIPVSKFWFLGILWAGPSWGISNSEQNSGG